jgi:UDP-N-acetyl-2-amino-2-deoxyglucuronate dehydrogenase
MIDRAMPGEGASDPVGFALLGAGAGAEAHAEALARVPGARLVVVADPELARARRLAERAGCDAVADPEEALGRPDVRAACVVAPNHLHAPLVMAAARHGRAVLLEKPPARDLAEAVALVEACAGRVPFGLVLQNRFAPEARALREAVRAGELGTPVTASVVVRCWRDDAYFRAGPWRGRRETAGGGALLVQAIHALDLLDWIAGPVVAAAARAGTRKHAVDVEDLLSAVLELASGATATLLATTAATPEFPARVELLGTQGSAVLLEARGAVRLWRGGAGPADLAGLAMLERELADHLAAPWPAGTSPELHRAVLADFVASLAEARRPAVDGEAALRLQGLVEAIYAAARTGQRVEVGTARLATG